ncbi:Clp protease N-terminal domain-containing protein [Cellulomonas sp. SLBN-39]|uniref:Clp protease N-terminal domain-containing protein n=1 Tax=Cellulomonas sp. SLBN-39 TaxID=2768446 RepID=UPI0011529959|nr:Clp protease N-terminal domain-containing protein [Cellulomonas sp. SLBN-39]TQL02643.1 ClpA/ClpB-like protein [Cellulomonas sp. SLBN-39]
MLIYDQTFVATMDATRGEATALGADAYGSEHLLLGLLTSADALTTRVVEEFPGLTAPAVRDAVREAADDAPHLARLGLTAPPAPTTDPARRAAPPRVKHRPELQAALNRATAAWGHLRKAHALPKERQLSSAVLWLAVLEPSARAPRLLSALGIDPDAVRTVVLRTLVPAGTPVPTWPTDPPVDPLTRLAHRIFGRTHVAR